MILCCMRCGHHFESKQSDLPCQLCGGKTDILLTDAEIDAIGNNEDLENIIIASKEPYKTIDNTYFNQNAWNNRISKYKEEKRADAIEKSYSQKVTTGYNFEGYQIIEYHKVISGNVVIGTGLFSDFTAMGSDLLGTTNNTLSDKMEKIKEMALERLLIKSVECGANAVIGVDFDFITLSGNMLGVSANGTAVTIEKLG